MPKLETYPIEKSRGSLADDLTSIRYSDLPAFNGTTQTYVGYGQNYLSTNGVGIRGFHRLVKSGQLLPMLYFEQFAAENESVGVYDVSNTVTGAYERKSVNNLDTDLTKHDLAEMRSHCDNLDAHDFVSCAAAKIYSSGWDALTFAAELHKTISMFKGFLSRNLSALQSGELYNMWLEGRYGWRIFIYDLIEINDAINNTDDGRKRYKDRCGDNWSSETSEIVRTYNFSSADWKVRRVTTVELSARGSVVADIEPPRIAVNPITTAWELIPYSFVIDWFVQVGKYLESMSFLTISRKHYAAAGWLVKSTKQLSYEDINAHTDHVCNHTNQSVGNAKLNVRAPSTVQSLPSFNVNLDVFKVMDLVALIWQRKK